MRAKTRALLFCVVFAALFVPLRLSALEIKLPTIDTTKLRGEIGLWLRGTSLEKLEAKEQRINRVTEKVETKYNALITQRVDKIISPDTHWGIKFGVGLLEGVPLGLKELGLFLYSTSEHLKLENMCATMVNSCYKVKDHPAYYTYYLKHPHQTGEVFGSALYQIGKQYVRDTFSDSRKTGNAVGGVLSPFVAVKTGKIAGSILKAAGTAVKNLPLAATTTCLIVGGPVAKSSKAANYGGLLFPSDTKLVPYTTLEAIKSPYHLEGEKIWDSLTTKKWVRRDALERDINFPADLNINSPVLQKFPDPEKKLNEIFKRGRFSSIKELFQGNGKCYWLLTEDDELRISIYKFDPYIRPINTDVIATGTFRRGANSIEMKVTSLSETLRYNDLETKLAQVIEDGAQRVFDFATERKKKSEFLAKELQKKKIIFPIEKIEK